MKKVANPIVCNTYRYWRLNELWSSISTITVKGKNDSALYAVQSADSFFGR
jgi:hypothetical protein